MTWDSLIPQPEERGAGGGDITGIERQSGKSMCQGVVPSYSSRTLHSSSIKGRLHIRIYRWVAASYMPKDKERTTNNFLSNFLNLMRLDPLSVVVVVSLSSLLIVPWAYYQTSSIKRLCGILSPFSFDSHIYKQGSNGEKDGSVLQLMGRFERPSLPGTYSGSGSVTEITCHVCIQRVEWNWVAFLSPYFPPSLLGEWSCPTKCLFYSSVFRPHPHRWKVLVRFERFLGCVEYESNLRFKDSS